MPPSGVVVDDFMWYRIEPLNSTPSMARYLLNECVIAGVGAMAVTAILASPVAPAVAAALGAGPGMSLLEIGAIGCGGGVAAGVASASVVWAWEEEDYIRDTAQTQIAALVENANRATAAVGENVAKALSDPAATVQATVAALSEGTANLLGQSGQAAGSAVQMAAATVSGWWFGQPQPVDDFVTYETASLGGLRDSEIVIH
ncbi:hypothetical protein [Azospirillum sp. ST 5-10]|uniref:hypothetical protein n=1 Tax=unclassified Azospirillum TaxID=2630922 RepID=UPI003F49B714